MAKDEESNEYKMIRVLVRPDIYDEVVKEGEIDDRKISPMARRLIEEALENRKSLRKLSNPDKPDNA